MTCAQITIKDTSGMPDDGNDGETPPYLLLAGAALLMILIFKR